jgi:predicted flavoprotein YhiN
VTSSLHPDDARAFAAAAYPPGRGRRELVGPLSAWSAEDTRAWFEKEGVPLKVEPSGKVFPVSDDSASIVDALIRAARDAGVTVRTNARVVDVVQRSDAEGGGFSVSVKGERGLRLCDCVCFSTGSSRVAHQWAARLGHKLIAPVPSLFTFKVKGDQRLEGLAGLAVPDSSARLVIARKNDLSEADGAGRKEKMAKRLYRKDMQDGLVQRGPVLITHWGLSGPAIIVLSSFGARLLHESAYTANCVVDFVPSMTREDKLDALKSARTRLAQKAIVNACPFRDKPPPNRLWRALVLYAGCEAEDRWADVTNDAIIRILDGIHEATFAVAGKGEFKEEFVTSGGVDASSLSTRSFESKHAPGAFFAGECVNVDGITGGFNFQFAWTSGRCSGNAIAEHLLTRAEN